MIRRPPDLPQAISSLILSLLLAVLVWVAATSTELRQITFPSTIPDQGLPINIVNVPEEHVVTEVEAATKVLATLLIPREQEGRLRRSDLVAYVDLAGKEAGKHQVEVKVERQEGSPPFRVISLHPDRLVVQLNRVTTRSLPIDVRVENTATIRQNYQVLTPTVEPPSVTISGPIPIVENIDKVIAEISVQDARDTVTREVELQVNGTDGEVDTGLLQLDPREAVVTVPIEQRQGYRELVVRALVQGNPARGYWVSRITVEPDTVTVVGQPPVVATLDGIVDTEPVDVEGLGEGEVIRRVALQLPENVSPLEDGFVSVRIKVEPQTSSKTVTLEPKVAGLEPGLTVTPGGIVPRTVDILLQGPIIELEGVSLDQITATLDLTGLPPGTHLLEPHISTPASLKAESVIPEQVEVTITEEQESRELRIPATVEGLAPDLAAVVEPATVVATIKGPVREVERLQAHEIQAVIDGTALRPGPQALTPQITMSDTLTVTQILPETVQATVVQRNEVRRLSAPISTVNLQEGLRASLHPSTVDLRVWGSGQSATWPVGNDTYRVELDLASLGPGSHLVRPSVRLPPHSHLVNILPDWIEVTIR